ncbi:MAG TPA: 50S ribosomal protein L29 [Candidatus Bathyarchaeota archaeon]|nr:50S ribosomal protein L29 [Candidatus Bathyarchaeota archaeon]
MPPILRVSEIRKMSDEERKRRLSELRAELMRAKTMVKAGGSLENPSRIRELRRAIARILTVMNEERRKGGR